MRLQKLILKMKHRLHFIESTMHEPGCYEISFEEKKFNLHLKKKK